MRVVSLIPLQRDAVIFTCTSKVAGLTFSDVACRPVRTEDTGRPERSGLLPATPTSAYRKPYRDCHPSDGARAFAQQPCASSLPIDAQHDSP